MNSQQNKNLNKFIKISLLGAIAVVLMYFDFPIPFLPFPWLKIDLSDIPALMGAFAFGPMAGIVVEFRKNALLGMALGTLSIEIIGIIANVYLLLPAFGMNMVKDELIQYVTIGLLPFNGIKSILVCGITYVLYKRVSLSIFKVDSNFDNSRKSKLNSI